MLVMLVAIVIVIANVKHVIMHFSSNNIKASHVINYISSNNNVNHAIKYVNSNNNVNHVIKYVSSNNNNNVKHVINYY